MRNLYNYEYKFLKPYILNKVKFCNVTVYVCASGNMYYKDHPHQMSLCIPFQHISDEGLMICGGNVDKYYTDLIKKYDDGSRGNYFFICHNVTVYGKLLDKQQKSCGNICPVLSIDHIVIN